MMIRFFTSRYYPFWVLLSLVVLTPTDLRGSSIFEEHFEKDHFTVHYEGKNHNFLCEDYRDKSAQKLVQAFFEKLQEEDNPYLMLSEDSEEFVVFNKTNNRLYHNQKLQINVDDTFYMVKKEYEDILKESIEYLGNAHPKVPFADKEFSQIKQAWERNGNNIRDAIDDFLSFGKNDNLDSQDSTLDQAQDVVHLGRNLDGHIDDYNSDDVNDNDDIDNINNADDNSDVEPVQDQGFSIFVNDQRIPFDMSKRNQSEQALINSALSEFEHKKGRPLFYEPYVKKEDFILVNSEPNADPMAAVDMQTASVLTLVHRDLQAFHQARYVGANNNEQNQPVIPFYNLFIHYKDKTIPFFEYFLSTFADFEAAVKGMLDKFVEGPNKPHRDAINNETFLLIAGTHNIADLNLYLGNIRDQNSIQQLFQACSQNILDPHRVYVVEASELEEHLQQIYLEYLQEEEQASFSDEQLLVSIDHHQVYMTVDELQAEQSENSQDDDYKDEDDENEEMLYNHGLNPNAPEYDLMKYKRRVLRKAHMFINPNKVCLMHEDTCLDYLHDLDDFLAMNTHIQSGHKLRLISSTDASKQAYLNAYKAHNDFSQSKTSFFLLGVAVIGFVCSKKRSNKKPIVDPQRGLRITVTTRSV